MFESFPENAWYAILLPSADQAGAESGAEFVVKVDTLPFGVKRKISEFPKRLLTKAISFATGDQTGLLSPEGSLVRRVGAVPSALTM